MPKREGFETINKRKFPPARSREEKEQQLGLLAYDCLEARLRDGTASSQEVCYALKAISSTAELEKKLMETEYELKLTRAEAIKAAQRTEEEYARVIAAMRRYQGSSTDDLDDIEYL